MAVSAVMPYDNVCKAVALPAVLPFCRAVAFQLTLYPQ